MSAHAYPEILAEADRVWEAARRIDELRGDTAASEWTVVKVRDLIRAGRADNAAEIAEIADALETRLARESEGVVERSRVEA